MGRSRRKYKKSRPKVRVGLPKRNPQVFKPSFCMPPKLRSLLAEQFEEHPIWDEKASVIHNYKSFGVLSNPNLLSVRSRTDHIVESDSLQVPPPSLLPSGDPDSVLDPSGSDAEEDGEFASLSPSLWFSARMVYPLLDFDANGKYICLDEICMVKYLTWMIVLMPCCYWESNWLDSLIICNLLLDGCLWNENKLKK